MRWVLRLLCVAYLAVLTALLLARQPMELIPPSAYVLARFISPASHFLTFSLLAYLMLAAQWPIRGLLLLVVLAAYGSGTEFLQYLVPPRTPEFVDFLQDVAGILAGVFLYWITIRWAGARGGRPGVEAETAAQRSPPTVSETASARGAAGRAATLLPAVDTADPPPSR